ncbi:GmrSD restriction endonuclease domain-containing protein [Mycobacteroides abscessus]|uniref:GmrSD restriction endonuclease domain-containing protein n=1 Tax=Mycobacteroides abscessus TaxID=36809 RepID=UPI002104240C|nr:DUF262 domain-containing protein [Mycobacteroides abscessus]
MAELDSQPKTIQSLYSWYSEDKLYVNRRYQRKLVWTLEEKQRLVESILNKYPIPAILIAERPGGTYEIIDGLQRLFTIMSFIETAFPTLSGEYFDVSKHATAKERSDGGHFSISSTSRVIDSRSVTNFLDYTVAMSVMRSATDAQIDDVFARINTYGHRLSDQERRQAGVQDDFSGMVRELACTLRGDASSDILNLSQMPSISIDLPMTKHGYEVRADEVFWVINGVLRSTDLRDSMDEQCIADIAACVVGSDLVERSRAALDAIYRDGDPENLRINAALGIHGVDRLQDEIKFCIDQLLQIAQSGTNDKLKNFLFSKPNNNGFPAIFATLIIALHEALIVGKKKICDYKGAKKSLTKLNTRIDTGRGSVTISERRKNIDVVKSLMSSHLAESDLNTVYRSHSVADIDAIIRRSTVELPDYELKQGLLRLDDSRGVDPGIIEKIVKTICAIANNGPGRGGSIIIGVTDNERDSARAAELDNILPRQIGSRHVVGVLREAKVLGESAETYFSKWKTGIRNSDLSDPLKNDTLSNMGYHDYFGLGIIVISIPPQSSLSYVGEDLYFRSGDETVKAETAKAIAGLAGRFAAV